MQLNISKDYQTLSLRTSEVILETVKNNPSAVLCFATGDSPRLAYELTVKKAIDENIDFTRCTIIALDEWVGIPPTSEGSCRFYLENLVFKPLGIQPSQTHLFDGMSEDLAGECSKMDEAIAATTGIDLMIVGVGLNGHIGFNEPGVSPELYAHVINLDDITLSTGQKYFTQATPLKQGITLGLKYVFQSKKLILIANGSKKAEVIQKAVEGPISNLLPASLLREHAQCLVMIDEEAAALLNSKNSR